MLSGRGRTKSRNDTKTFPLPDDFFPAVELSDEQIQSYEAQVNEIVRNALLEYERHEAKGAYPIYGSPWVSVGTEGSLTAIRQESPEGLSRSEFRVYGRINGNYRSLMDFHYAETSEQLFEWNQFMFGYAVDAVVLKNIHKRSSGKPHEYLGIKWTCLHPSSFSRKRDMCYLECLTYTKDELGRNVGVRVTLPAEIDECPDLYRTLKVKRVKTHSVTILRPAESSSDATHLFAMSENDFAGLSVSAKSFRKMMRMHNDMSMYVESKQISRQGMMSKANWVPKESRKACTNCKLTFNAAMRHRYHCRLCGDIFCRHCVIVRGAARERNGEARSRVFQVAKTPFCKACLSATRHENEVSQATASDTSAEANARKSDATSADRKRGKLTKTVSGASDCSSRDWWEENASDWTESDWSETESEDTGKASLNASGRSRLASSLSSSHSSWTSISRPDDSLEKDDISFVATLDVIDDDVAVLDEKPRRPKLHRKLSSRFSKSQRLERNQPTIMQEVTEVIDTTDMLPMSEFRRSGTGFVLPDLPSKYSRRRGSRDSLLASSAPRPSRHLAGRDEPTNRFQSSRSISQCLAEQEELLRCMLSVSRVHSNPGVGSTRRIATPGKVDFAATMPVQRSNVRLYEI